jgi:uncharacterized protein YggE
MKRVLICLAIAGCAAAPALAQEVDSTRVVRPYWWDQPVVEGLGRAELEVQPNRAFFSVSFVHNDSDAARSADEPIARARLAYDAIKKVTGNKARVETSIEVEPYYEQYRDKEGELIDNERADKVKGYQAKATVTAYLSDISLAGPARAAAMALGPQVADDIEFDVVQTVDMQRAAFKLAAEDARARAQIAATAAGGMLGGLLVLQEGQGPCMGNWSTAQIARQAGSPPPPPSTSQGAQSALEFARSLSVGERRVVVTGSRYGGGRIELTEADIERYSLPSDGEPQTVDGSVCAIYVLKK